MTDRPSWSPDEVDPTRPSVARVYDYYLGGSHNFAADREFGRRALETFPDALSAIRDNRVFIRRAVRYACENGVHQFLDLGSGIPTVGNVHEVAQEVAPGARVVYVDHDPLARPLAPCSLLALSHTRSDGRPETVGMARVYDDDADSPGRPRLRSREEIASLFGGLTLVEPGVVVLPRWRPELTGDPVPPEVDDHPGLCGVGRRD